MRARRRDPVIPKAGSGVCIVDMEQVDRACLSARLEGMMSKGQKYNPAWPDSAEARTRRTQERRKRIRELIVAAGWKGESALLTAFGDGIVEVPRNPAGAQAAQKGD